MRGCSGRRSRKRGGEGEGKKKWQVKKEKRRGGEEKRALERGLTCPRKILISRSAIEWSGK